jgi:hypothetical protein
MLPTPLLVIIINLEIEDGGGRAPHHAAWRLFVPQIIIKKNSGPGGPLEGVSANRARNHTSKNTTTTSTLFFSALSTRHRTCRRCVRGAADPKCSSAARRAASYAARSPVRGSKTASSAAAWNNTIESRGAPDRTRCLAARTEPPDRNSKASPARSTQNASSAEAARRRQTPSTSTSSPATRWCTNVKHSKSLCADRSPPATG